MRDPHEPAAEGCHGQQLGAMRHLATVDGDAEILRLSPCICGETLSIA
jgi:hypothetical protein